MKKIAVLVDSSADISNEEALKEGLHVVRMPLIVDDETFMECDEITDSQLIEKMNSGAKVKTSQPILGDLIAKWDELLQTYDQVLYIPISIGLSGTHSSAVLASESYEGKVVVVDSVLIAYPLQYTAIKAKELLEKGYSAEEVKRKIEEEVNMFAVIVPETLTHLKNGGRISPAAAALGNFLKILPLLKYESGKIDALDKVRTQKKAYLKALEYIQSSIEGDKSEYQWYITHSGCRERAEELSELVKDQIGEAIEIRPLRAIITVHTGPGTIAIGRIKKIKD